MVAAAGGMNMREILFRGKRLDNGEWVEGAYCPKSCDSPFGPMIDKPSIIKLDDPFSGFRFDVDPSTVGQYTGTDKNGKKIFEGDIVDASEEWWNACGPAGHDSPIMVVSWNECVSGFDPFADYDCDCGVYINDSGCKVIGNIHDNPELLEVADATN